MSAPLDLTGQKFGRLTVIGPVVSAHGASQNGALWLCVCECGTKRECRSGLLRRGLTRSCGCLGREAQERRRLAAAQAIGNMFGFAPRVKP